jgi:hypothetical protein
VLYDAYPLAHLDGALLEGNRRGRPVHDHGSALVAVPILDGRPERAAREQVEILRIDPVVGHCQAGSAKDAQYGNSAVAFDKASKQCPQAGSGVYGWSPRQDNLVFKCLDENDPAYLQPQPKTVESH